MGTFYQIEQTLCKERNLGQGETLHNDIFVNPQRRHSEPDYVFTKQQHFKAYEAKTHKAYRRNRQINS